ncbi:MAG: Eco47II family restriction endonuclease [Actinomycetota bacterium]|jgi:hypothetical protein|nr:Eco47II family restriction endonuclease [Actinomycetota bacterium]
MNLPFISDSDFLEAVRRLVKAVEDGRVKADSDPYRNGIDPFSSLVDAAHQNISPREWLEQEKARQAQKSLQNAIGAFHQNILGSMPGWRDAGYAGSFDVENSSRGIIAEVKNKHNTMNATGARGVYATLAEHLDGDKSGFMAYLVQIIPKTPTPYDEMFASHRSTPLREDIRRIDGKSFYALASGDPDAVQKIYEAMPEMLSKILPVKPHTLSSSPEFIEFYEQVYGND